MNNFELGDSCLISKRFIHGCGDFKPWRSGTVIAVGSDCVRVSLSFPTLLFRRKVWIRTDHWKYSVTKVKEA